MRFWHYFTILSLLNGLCPAYGQNPLPTDVLKAPGSLSIQVIKGEGGKNGIKARIAAPVVIEVHDANGRPVAGAQVIFQLPAFGPSGTFPGGALVQRTVTNGQGQAMPDGFVPNDQEGRLNIKVMASLAGASATQVIAQSNVMLTGLEKHNSGKTKWLIIAAAGAAAVGVIVGVKGSSGGAPTVAPSSVVLVPGTVTVGGPR